MGVAEWEGPTVVVGGPLERTEMLAEVADEILTRTGGKEAEVVVVGRESLMVGEENSMVGAESSKVGAGNLKVAAGNLKVAAEGSVVAEARILAEIMPPMLRTRAISRLWDPEPFETE